MLDTVCVYRGSLMLLVPPRYRGGPLNSFTHFNLINPLTYVTEKLMVTVNPKNLPRTLLILNTILFTSDPNIPISPWNSTYLLGIYIQGDKL